MDLERTPDSSAAQWLTVDVVATVDHRLARLGVAGELDRSTAAELLEAVAAVLDGPPLELVELNLADLRFVDSAGIRCLLDCRTVVEAAGSRLMLTAPGPRVVRALEITGLLGVFGLPHHADPPHRNRALTDALASVSRFP